MISSFAPYSITVSVPQSFPWPPAYLRPHTCAPPAMASITTVPGNSQASPLCSHDSHFAEQRHSPVLQAQCGPKGTKPLSLNICSASCSLATLTPSTQLLKSVAQGSPYPLLTFSPHCLVIKAWQVHCSILVFSSSFPVFSKLLGTAMTHPLTAALLPPHPPHRYLFIFLLKISPWLHSTGWNSSPLIYHMWLFMTGPW